MAIQNDDEIQPFSDAAIRRLRAALFYLGLVLLLAAIPVAYVLGKRHGAGEVRANFFEQQKSVLASIMEEDRGRFGKLYFEDGHDHIVVKGDVPVNADRELLEQRVALALGSDMAAKVLRLVGMENFQ